MRSVSVTITRFVDDFPQPGIVECALVDIDGLTHLFVDKFYYVSDEELSSSSQYPQSGRIRCTINAELKDDAGRDIIKIDTDNPDAVRSTTENTQFVVLASQVIKR